MTNRARSQESKGHHNHGPTITCQADGTATGGVPRRGRPWGRMTGRRPAQVRRPKWRTCVARIRGGVERVRMNKRGGKGSNPPSHAVTRGHTRSQRSRPITINHRRKTTPQSSTEAHSRSDSHFANGSPSGMGALGSEKAPMVSVAAPVLSFTCSTPGETGAGE